MVKTFGHARPASEPMSFSDRQAAMLAAVDGRMISLLAAGAPTVYQAQTLHVALDDGSRADLTAMATTAVAAAAQSIPWPASYQTGWITMENVRIPLPAPADGLGLAALIGDYYAQIRQHGRNLKDTILAAQDNNDLDQIDIEAGWP